jgi:hypothetical protein
MKKPDFDKLTQEQCARVHGVTTRAVQKWDLAGHPRNDDGSYCASESVQWRLDREVHDGLNVDAERAKLLKAQSEKALLDLAVRRGTLLERSEVVQGGCALLGAMRARLRAIAARIAPEVSTPETYTAVRTAIAAAIDEALEEISDENFVSRVAAHSLAERAGDSGETATQADSKRVGRRAPRALQRERGRAR